MILMVVWRVYVQVETKINNEKNLNGIAETETETKKRMKRNETKKIEIDSMEWRENHIRAESKLRKMKTFCVCAYINEFEWRIFGSWKYVPCVCVGGWVWVSEWVWVWVGEWVNDDLIEFLQNLPVYLVFLFSVGQFPANSIEQEQQKERNFFIIFDWFCWWLWNLAVIWRGKRNQNESKLKRNNDMHDRGTKWKVFLYTEQRGSEDLLRFHQNQNINRDVP